MKISEKESLKCRIAIMLLRHDFIYSVWVDISKGFSRISKKRVRFGTIENPFYVYKEHSFTLRDMDFNLLAAHLASDQQVPITRASERAIWNLKVCGSIPRGCSQFFPSPCTRNKTSEIYR